jgi:hypothetical protein
MTKKSDLPPEAEEVLDEVGEKEKKKTADKLIEIAIEQSYRDDDAPNAAGGLFHTKDGIVYADIEIDGRRETWPIRSRGFKRWLSRIFYEVEGTAPNSEALQSALLLCEARAHFDGPEREVFIRVGGARGKIYVDLANERWQVIEISPTGWRILDSKQVPIRFRRAPGLLPLPLPLTGGTIDDLRTFLNVKSDDDFELALAWLLAAMRDRGPYPILALMGEHGTAKSTFVNILRSLIDPNTAALRSFPREDRDLFIAASNGWIVGYDNVSRIPSWLSDAMCRLATGGGFSTRKLYSDDEEQLFNAQRPIALNGIEDFVERPDLADRTIFLTLEPIPEDRRKADQALQDDVERARPLILGALLDRLVCGLQRLPSTQLAQLPRMADFAIWATACESSPGSFMRAYEGNRAAAVEMILEADLVAIAVRRLMANRGGQEWRGTATVLLQELGELIDEGQRRGREWPKASNVLSGRLRRAATNLRKIGVEIVTEPSHKQGRIIRIRVLGATRPDKEGKTPSSPSPPLPDGKKPNGGSGLGVDDTVAMTAAGSPPSRPQTDEGEGEGAIDRPHRPPTVHANPLKNKAGHDVDDGDDDLRTQSSWADLDIPECLRRKPEPTCRRCGVPGSAAHGDLIPAGRDGAAGLYHQRCWGEERTQGPRQHRPGDPRAKVDIIEVWPPELGPPGDDVFDLDPGWRQ